MSGQQQPLIGCPECAWGKVAGCWRCGSKAEPAATHTIHRVDLAGQVRQELRRPDGSIVGHFMTVSAAEEAAVGAAALQCARAAIAHAARRSA